ncbi:esterase-like activity of phytase family protein [Mycolicibacterium fluoranthenivorans]|uniref:Esterase-like activity of phytase family protein n=1 Tax=Mycolicibacterium fluoranthenivorans TaxID=258505 RepID=A0A7G8PPQ2_9MYCO|nr:esterase-like activity of phytase family protein [Mycolicibacterium fluoranthenivorans]
MWLSVGVKLSAVVLSAVLVVAGCAAAPAPTSQLEFLGKVELAHGLLFADTTVGGLSGITYDAGRDQYYVISDDRSAKSPARFYTMSIALSGSNLARVDLRGATPLLNTDGQRFAPKSATTVPPDPEGIAFDSRRQQLYWSSEGERIVKPDAPPVLLDPWVRTAGLDGAFRGQFALPPELHMSATDAGPRKNQALEGLTLAPDGTALWAGMEDPGFNDGPLPTAEHGALTRITRLDPETREATAQYAYPLDPVSSGAGGGNGLSDLVALNAEDFLVIERGHGTRTSVHIYRASIAGADDILGRPSSAGAAPIRKTLVADLSETVKSVDNVEGITLGPKLSDGRQSVIMVTDDNFSPDQVTQLLAFAL